ncbi:M48 family metalloprotease [Candidatus Woesearchaeota archaeon]|nr:M48 family metalloprotease [Candidatus Woesearchaeota archaeon]
MEGHVLQYIAEFISNPKYLALTILSLALSIAAFFAMIKVERKTLLAYAHVGLLLTPLVAFGVTLPCSMSSGTGLVGLLQGEVCSIEATRLVLLYVLPLSFVSALLVGLFAMPWLYRMATRAKRLHSGTLYERVRVMSLNAGLRVPRVYLLDSAKPVAFSCSGITSAVFISVGMLDLLSPKQADAVLLHELGHIKHKSSWHNVSARLLGILQPLASFPLSKTRTAEEVRADGFAAAAQGTRRYLAAAKQAVDAFYLA